MAEGEFHESLNLAALWELPVLFLCENNRYAMGTALERHQSQTDISRKADAYGMRRRRSTAWTSSPSRQPPRRAVGARPRAVGGPFLLEARTYRFRAHSMYDPELYRSKEEVEEWKRRDPIPALAARLSADGAPHPARSSTPWSCRRRRSRRCRGLRRGGPVGAREDLARDVHGEGGVVTTATYREAVRSALREALRERSARVPHGRGRRPVRRRYAVSHGLLEEFGPERVRDTPLSESAFVGAGIGAAMGGMRPIVEIMTVNFSLLALDQIVNNAATPAAHVGRTVSVPLVIRMATGGGTAAGRAALAQPRGLVCPRPGHHASSRPRRRRTREACCWPRSASPIR